MTTSLELGSMTVSWLCGGDFELDGGTMFGPVPRVLWKKKYPPDKDNYKQLLPGYRKENCWFTFYHDIFMKGCRLDERGKVVSSF